MCKDAQREADVAESTTWIPVLFLVSESNSILRPDYIPPLWVPLDGLFLLF